MSRPNYAAIVARILADPEPVAHVLADLMAVLRTPPTKESEQRVAEELVNLATRHGFLDDVDDVLASLGIEVPTRRVTIDLAVEVDLPITAHVDDLGVEVTVTHDGGPADVVSITSNNEVLL